ncbi:MAG: HD family phosphohydrolase [Elainellaceae cyanobacterium]
MKSFRLMARRFEQWCLPTNRSPKRRIFSGFSPHSRTSQQSSLPHEKPPSTVDALVEDSIGTELSPANRGEPRPSSRGLLVQSRELMTWLGEYPSCSGTTRPKRGKLNRYAGPLLCTIAVASLTSAIGYRLYNKPQLSVGTVAPQTLRAPNTVAVEDEETTRQRRLEASQGAVPVLAIDADANQRIYQSLSRLIDVGDDYREQAGPFPFVAPSVLSTTAQDYLRTVSEAGWQRILTVLAQGLDSVPLDSSVVTAKPSQELVILELQGYKNIASADDFSALKQSIIRARQSYATAAEALDSSSGPSTLLTDSRILSLSDSDWNRVKAVMRQTLERILLQGIPKGLPDDQLQTAIKSQLKDDAPRDAAPLAAAFLFEVIQPNLVEDTEQTRLQAERTAEAVEPEMVKIREGEVIVAAEETIERSQFVLLDYFGLSRRGVDWLGLVGFAGVVSGSVVIFLLVERRFHARLRQRDHVLVLLLSLSTPLLPGLGLPTTSLPAVGLLVGSFYGSSLGIAVVALLGAMLPLGMTIAAEQLVASIAGGLVGTLLAGRLRSREELALLGGAVGLVQGVVYLIISLIISTATSPVWLVMLTGSFIQALMGVAWSIVALGVSPYLENLFDLVTPIRLVELSNPNRPTLKRLASEAPGTFQHTLFVASLAEAAARELGCNVELVRAGTLYHDIGKMHDPEGFIENQMGGTNKHDIIDDPWVSAQIIKKHVSEGLVMARKCRLPGAIQAFIPEHQGTMLITYFYYQAKERAKADPTIEVKEEDFRYRGPTPQSRETGIVMVADSCEAALRSLKDATPEEALAMVNRILRARWQDNQLVDSGLSRQDMAHIAEIFVRVWQQYNHKRIPYPKAALTPPPSPMPL